MTKQDVLCRMALAAIALGALTACAAPVKQNAAGDSFTPAQKAEIAGIVQQTIINNPQILVEAVDRLHKEEEVTASQQAASTILQNRDAIINDPDSPVIGSSSAKVAVIEFMDYQCVYCHQDYPVVKALIANNPDVKFIFKEFPIFGSVSSYAAEIALGAYQQGQFAAFHNALFDTGLMEGQLTQKAVDAVAKKTGVNVAEAKTFASNELTQNQQLATSLGISGTPDFIIMPVNGSDPQKITFLPGAVPYATLQNAINLAGSTS